MRSGIRRLARRLLPLFVASAALGAFAGCFGSGDGGISGVVIVGDSDFDPAWSPDGSQIAYQHRPGSPMEQAMPSGIYLIGPTGVGRRLLVAGEFSLPDWSPDGLTIASRGPGGRIHLIDVATQTITPIGPGDCFFPSWSPDGDMIAFDTSRGDPRGAHAIWIMRSDGSDARDISVHGTGEWRDPDWGPDGRRLLMQRYMAGHASPEICMLDTSGTTLGCLTEGPAYNESPTWSADGRGVAWSRMRGGVTEVWVVPPGSAIQRRLTTGQEPAWSPDGRRLAFTRTDPDGRTRLFTIGLDGKALVPLSAP